MKKLLTFALALMVLAAFTGLGVAQEKKAWEKPTQGKLPFVGKQQLMTGKITGVDPTGKTFTVMSKGQAVTVSAAKLPALPRVGEIVDITYTQTPGGPMAATTVTASKSNSQE